MLVDLSVPINAIDVSSCFCDAFVGIFLIDEASRFAQKTRKCGMTESTVLLCESI